MNLKQMVFYNKLKRGNKINCDLKFKGGVLYSTLNEEQLNLPEKYQIINKKVYYKDKPICEFKQSDDLSMNSFIFLFLHFIILKSDQRVCLSLLSAVLSFLLLLLIF